jgi:PAS domain S-box-containing protein
MDDTVSAPALRDSEELHRITLLSMSDAVFITDDDGAFTYICPNVDVIFGYAHEEVRAMERISRLMGRELVGRRRSPSARRFRTSSTRSRQSTAHAATCWSTSSGCRSDRERRCTSAGT